MRRAAGRRRAFVLMFFGGAVALFHLWLLWSRVAGDRAWDGVAALRWLGTSALLAAWLTARRNGSLRREQVFVWAALVLLLHAAGGPAAEAQVSFALALSGWLLVLRRTPVRVAAWPAFGFSPLVAEPFFPDGVARFPFAARPPPPAVAG